LAGDGLDVVADAQGEGVAAHFALLAGQEVDADVGQVRALAQVVVAHEAIEVHGRALADGGGEIDDLGDGLEVLLDFADDGIGGFERGAFGQVDDDLQLVLVVERQHLQRHAAGEGQEDGEAEEAGDDEHQDGAASARRDEGIHQAAVDAIGGGGLDVVGGDLGGGILEQLAGDPRRDGEGDEQGGKHRERHVEGHGGHVGAHHAADEEHRDERDDDGQRGQQDGRHDLLHRERDGLQARELLHGEEARDVFDADDGVVDEEPQREDQREEGHAVDGVAQHVVEQEGERVGDGDGEADDDAFAPAHGEGDEADDGQDAHDEVQDEVVDLLVGGVAVVADDGRLHAVGDEAAAQFAEHALDVLGHGDGVAAFLLGHGDGHGGIHLAGGHAVVDLRRRRGPRRGGCRRSVRRSRPRCWRRRAGRRGGPGGRRPSGCGPRPRSR
jgi:hypothetical protein